MSGRYRSDSFVRHFSDTDSTCQLCQEKVPGTIEHLLLICPSLTTTRDKLIEQMNSTSDICDASKSLIRSALLAEATAIQLLLDCSTMPDVILTTQTEGNIILEELFRFFRSWCYFIHKTRMKLLIKFQNINCTFSHLKFVTRKFEKI